ncbi:MAG: hypothetical protein JWP46_4466 [Modestobacter sp.]|nr:hypothetical protein [Modestobacter sp.]
MKRLTSLTASSPVDSAKATAQKLTNWWLR